MTLVTIVFLTYLLLVLVVGALAARYGRTMEGYFLADRRLGAWVTAISSVASSESGWLVIGLVGEAYLWGAKAIWTAPGCLIGYLCNWYLVAPRLRQHSGQLDAITIPDFLEARFGERWRILRAVGILIILFCLMFYVSAQFTATGKAFQTAFGETWGITYPLGVLIGGVITILYTLVGGFRAVSWTDLVQGLLMAFGLIVLPIVTVASIGGFGVLLERLEQVPERVEGIFTRTAGTHVEILGVEQEEVFVGEGLRLRRLIDPVRPGEARFLLITQPAAPEQGPAAAAGVSPVRVNGQAVHGERELEPGDRLEIPGAILTFDRVVQMPGGEDMADTFGGAVGAGLLGWVIGLFGIGLGYPGQPQVLARYMAARSRRTLQRGRLIAMVWGCLAMYGAVVLGLAARVAVPGLVDPEQAYPYLATTLLPPVLAGVLLAAIISAMMSTADSQLLVVSSAVARDFIDKTLGIRRRLSSRAVARAVAWVPRLSVLVIGIIALVLALGEVRAVFWFVLFAWSGLGAAFGPPLLLALFWRRVTMWGVLAGMVSGFAVTLLWKTTWKASFAAATGVSLYELVPAFVVALVLTWLVSLLDPSGVRPPDGLEGLEGRGEGASR